jgi:hypothetical protein
MQKLPPGTIIVHGDADGADRIAGAIAKEMGFEVRAYPADWDAAKKAGRLKAAGPIRNSLMLKKEHPDKEGVFIDLVLAFSENFELSRGTNDMMGKAVNAKPPIFVDPFSV